MARKQQQHKDSAEKTAKQEEVDSKDTNGPEETQGSKKRKQPAPTDPNKQPRRSGRNAPKSEASPSSVLDFLLSSKALESCAPADETEAISKDENLRTYTNGTASLTPFEELVSAVILSRPISHRLGLRSIRTIFNAPYEFTSPKAIRDAGAEKRHQALWDAKTQHKQKTVEELELLAEAFDTDGQDQVGLDHIREEASQDIEKEREILKSRVKGLGATGLDIFCRRIQWLWPEAYPFVDKRTAASLEKLGLPSEGERLRNALEEVWAEAKGNVEGKDEDEAKRKAFVIILERATGAELESKTDEVLAQAVQAD
ncbi:MAG: hypothetical protein M1820_001088 [Bogoriella megaspora]|nr:MAG: hypothetical protein M1820_001088 [Bogoriella megaspora]